MCFLTCLRLGLTKMGLKSALQVRNLAMQGPSRPGRLEIGENTQKSSYVESSTRSQKNTSNLLSHLHFILHSSTCVLSDI